MDLFKESKIIRNRKERHHGDISSKGIYNEMLDEAKKIVNECSEENGVMGITLCGGLSRGYTDELSEIDLNIYLEDDIYKDWIIGMGPVPHSDALWKGSYIKPIYKFTDIIIQNGKKLIVFNKIKYIREKDKRFPDILEWSKPLLNRLILK